MLLNQGIACTVYPFHHGSKPAQSAVQVSTASSCLPLEPSPQKFQFQYVLLQAQTTAQMLYNLGLAAHKAGQLDAAIQAYQDAIELDPAFDAAYINLGLAYIQINQFAAAQAMFEQALSLPDRLETPASIHTVAYYNLAIILERQGQTDAAVSEVQKALAITPDFERAQQLLQRLQSNSQPASGP